MAGAVNGEVDENVDPIASDQLRRAHVVHSPDVSKVFPGPAPVLVGHRVRTRDRRIKVDVEERTIVVPEERHQELPQGVVATKVRRDVTDAQPAIGFPIGRVGASVLAQRLGVEPGPVPRLGSECCRVVAGVGERHEDQVAVRVVVRGVELHGAPVAGDGPAAIALFGERVPEVMVSRRQVRGERNRAPAVRRRQRHPMKPEEHPGEAHVKLGAVGAERHRALQVRMRLVGGAGVHQHEPEVVVRLGEIGIGRDGPLASRCRGRERPLSSVSLAEVGEVCGVRSDRHQTLQQEAGLLEAPRLEAQAAQHEESSIVLRLAGEDLAVKGLRLLGPSGAVVGRRSFQEIRRRPLWLHVAGAPRWGAIRPWTTRLYKVDRGGVLRRRRVARLPRELETS